jgi:hypothetical protein
MSLGGGAPKKTAADKAAEADREQRIARNRLIVDRARRKSLRFTQESSLISRGQAGSVTGVESFVRKAA